MKLSNSPFGERYFELINSINNKTNKMEKLLVPLKKNVTKGQLNGTSTQSTLSWEGLKPSLEKIFHVQPNEEIKGIILTEQGITALFETK